MAGSTVADLVGRVLAGRYRLLGAIGSGASGRVYVADDVRLRRRVAVKVLHPGLAADAGFLRRFRSEAQLAASLHHPNVMAVYDWGEDGVPFMVLELLSGGSLRGMLDAGTRLSPAQAAHVGGQVAAALDYAHSRGLVHRDIKPANLLFDEHGIVRVADFGLARALAEASWTEPAGAVVGTARYAAPEQGSGAPLDGRADLYALGLVLVESITGSVPLVADTPLGTVGLRQDTNVDVPAAVDALAPVVARACASDPADRFANADRMRAALSEIASVLPPPGPLALAGIGAMGEDPHPTQVVRTLVESPLFDQDEVPPARTAARPVAGTRVPPRSRSTAPFVMGLVVAIAVAAIAYVLVQPDTGPMRPVPLLVGQTYTKAQDIALRKNFLVDKTVQRSDDPSGFVIAQRPIPGGFLNQRRTIHLVVSSGPAPVAVPDLTGKTKDEAVAALSGQFAVETADESSMTVPSGQVIRTEPAGKAPPDSTVKVVVSTGPPLVDVPDVTGTTYDDAVAALAKRKFGATRAEDFSDTVPVGQVISTQPAAGSKAPLQSKITVTVSKGPDLVVVPDFKGKSIEEATALGAAQGVQVQAQGTLAPGKKVRAQDPPPGGQVKRATVVTIFF
jgi:eukaryotic-like serine/threonine-protein kinase